MTRRRTLKKDKLEKLLGDIPRNYGWGTEGVRTLRGLLLEINRGVSQVIKDGNIPLRLLNRVDVYIFRPLGKVAVHQLKEKFHRVDGEEIPHNWKSSISKKWDGKHYERARSVARQALREELGIGGDIEVFPINTTPVESLIDRPTRYPGILTICRRMMFTCEMPDEYYKPDYQIPHQGKTKYWEWVPVERQMAPLPPGFGTCIIIQPPRSSMASPRLTA